MKNYLFLGILVLTSFVGIAQEDEDFEDIDDEVEMSSPSYVKSFTSSRIINGHSVETQPKGELQFIIAHRFGAICTLNDDGKVILDAQNMIGFDNASDIRFAFEYGLTDKMLIGFGRSKGAGNPYRALLDGFYKYRFLSQGENAPLSMAVLAMGAYSYMTASEDISEVSNFPKFSHRFSYTTQVHFSRNFYDRFSLALIPSVVHRNYVNANDNNTLFAIGAGTMVNVSKKVSINLEYYHVLAPANNVRVDAQNSLAVAVEWHTFGHNFKINFTNSKGFGETQFITGTVSDWLKGQFRIGFSISRSFQLLK